jgi:hypothetical protein
MASSNRKWVLPGLAVLFAAIYGGGSAFTMSREWFSQSFIVSALVALTLLLLLAVTGRIRPILAPDKGVPRKVAHALLLALATWVTSWLIVGRTIPAFWTWEFATDEQVTATVSPHKVHFKKYRRVTRPTPYEMLISVDGGQIEATYKIDEGDFKHFTAPAQTQALIRRTRFGAFVIAVESASIPGGMSPHVRF